MILGNPGETIKEASERTGLNLVPLYEETYYEETFYPKPDVLDAPREEPIH